MFQLRGNYSAIIGMLMKKKLIKSSDRKKKKKNQVLDVFVGNKCNMNLLSNIYSYYFLGLYKVWIVQLFWPN